MSVKETDTKFVTIGINDSTVRWSKTKNEEEIEDDQSSISSEEGGGLCSDIDHRVRAKSIKEIWEEEVIWESLQALPGANEIIEHIINDDFEAIVSHPDGKDTGIMLASWIGNDKVVKYLLENNANVNFEDAAGRSPLHLAACNGNEISLKLLLDHKATVTKWDALRKATPLHCAASRGFVNCMKLLIKHGADVNAGICNKSPLHYAVQCNSIECVKELLNVGAIPNTTKIFSETPLHIAASLGSAEIIKLLLEHKAEVRVQCGPDKTTALHLAAEDGNCESAKLLLDAGSQISARNYKQQTPVHLAALSQSSETLELLLTRGGDPNARDIDGRTPLHGAIVKVSRSCECVQILIKYGANVNAADVFGYTPMHLAALNEFSQCILLLLNNGGDVTARTNGNVSVLAFITRRTPDVIPKYIEKLNQSIKVNDHEIGDVDCELKLDFRILVPSTCKGETELLLNFIEVGHREVLKHPLCETFLFLKWRRIRKYFLFSLFYHLLFAALFTAYILGVYLNDCPLNVCNTTEGATPDYNTTEVATPDCHIATEYDVVGYILTILNIILMGKEIFQILHCWKAYVKQWENWLQWLIIISVFCSVVVKSASNYEWQHIIAAVGILITWLELMMIVGRFPIFGLYVQMFTTVSVNFAKFLMAYFCLLVGFSMGLCVLLPDYPAFKNILRGFSKTIMMMIGEMEFEDIFYGNCTGQSKITQVMFVAFVILVTIILMNLMVGLAVNDIQGLQQSAGLDRLVRQAELIAHLEREILFSRLLHWVPKNIMVFFHKYALLLKSQFHWALYIRPNDPRETRIPKDLIKSINGLVTEMKPIKKRRSAMNQNRQSYDVCNNVVHSPSLSRINSRMSTTSFDINTQNAFRMRLASMRTTTKTSNYQNVLMK